MSSTSESAANKPVGVEFIIGGLAAVGAGCFTNPMDVIKVRLQLQGELEARGTYKRIYKNTFHATYLIAKHEGIFALQAGLAPALAFQVVLNGIRLGTYNIAKRFELTLNNKGETDIVKTALVSGIAGAIGGIAGSPFYLVKTQIQAQSSQAIAVGHQHSHQNSWTAYKSLWKENGIAGLYRGCFANVPRLFVGSSTQLTTFSIVSDWLRKTDMFSNSPLLLTFVASLIGGSCVAVTMQPFDVLATRLYNQRVDKNGKGTLYNGLYDGIKKILVAEGITGLYKGVVPTWIRIAPHTVLCLSFYENLDLLYKNWI